MADDAIATFEVVSEIKCLAERFFNAWVDHVTLLPKLLPHMFKSAIVVKGDGKSVDSVVDWEYLVDPPTVETTRQTIEAIDEKNMVYTATLYGGDLGRKFCIFRPILKVYKKGNQNYANCTLDFKKTYDEIPNPYNYMAFLEKVIKELDSALPMPNNAV